MYATVIEKEPQNSISAYSLWYAYCILNKRTGEENKAASHGLETYFKKKKNCMPEYSNSNKWVPQQQTKPIPRRLAQPSTPKSQN